MLSGFKQWKAAAAMRRLFLRPVGVGMVLAVYAVPVLAADEAGKFAVDGIGKQSCAVFTKAVEDDNREQIIAFASWTSGFVTGANVYGTDTFDITPWQTVELLQAKLLRFCKANPDTPFIQGLGRLVASIEADRVKQSDQLVSVRYAGQAVYIYTSVLERVRARLIEAEYELPAAEGVFDDSFASALQTYQSDKGLPLTGLPDLATMNALFP